MPQALIREYTCVLGVVLRLCDLHSVLSADGASVRLGCDMDAASTDALAGAAWIVSELCSGGHDCVEERGECALLHRLMDALDRSIWLHSSGQCDLGDTSASAFMRVLAEVRAYVDPRAGHEACVIAGSAPRACYTWLD